MRGAVPLFIGFRLRQPKVGAQVDHKFFGPDAGCHRLHGFHVRQARKHHVDLFQDGCDVQRRKTELMERFEVREQGGHRQADGLIRGHVGDRDVRVTVQ